MRHTWPACPARPAYPSDLSATEWAILADLVPEPAPNGRPAEYARREIVNAILYINRTGGAWRSLPHDFPPWPTCYYYFALWRKSGLWEQMLTALREHVRGAAQREPTPSAAILDSQSVKSVGQGSAVGFDGGKQVKGRKRHVLVDTLGLLLVVVVTAANVSDKAGAQTVLQAAQGRFPRLQRIWADGGYPATLIEWLKQLCGWVFEIIEHLVVVHEFKLLPRRWVVERTLGWLKWARRLSKDYETLPSSSEAMIEIAMIRILVRRLAHPKARTGRRYDATHKRPARGSRKRRPAVA